MGPDRHLTRWWHPWSWLVAPAVYLAVYVALDLQVYVDLDPSDPAAFATNTMVLLVVLLAAAYALHFVARIRPGLGIEASADQRR